MSTPMTLEEYERIQPNCQVDGMSFYLPNRHCEWRIQTMYTKEPDTVAWIKSMKPSEVFFDVGACIGMYSVIAAKQGLLVFAFEPESQNYATLIRNFAMNKFSKAQAVAFPFCVTDEGMKLDTLRLSSLMAGGSCHSFASDKNYKMEEKTWLYEQGTIGFSLDTLVFECGIPQPHHIKVDVDGFEDKVLLGARRVLRNTRSILVEMDSANETHMGWADHLREMGFTTNDEQIDTARRKEGPFTGIGNIIFTRPIGVLAGVTEDNPVGVGSETEEG